MARTQQSNEKQAPVPTSDYAAGSEDFTGEEDTTAPVASSTQSDSALSKSSAVRSQDARFSIAEEVNLDQQSDAVRDVGQMPQDTSAEHIAQMSASEAMAKSMQQDQPDAKQRLKQALDRAVPPSSSSDDVQ